MLVSFKLVRIRSLPFLGNVTVLLLNYRKHKMYRSEGICYFDKNIAYFRSDVYFFISAESLYFPLLPCCSCFFVVTFSFSELGFVSTLWV